VRADSEVGRDLYSSQAEKGGERREEGEEGRERVDGQSVPFTIILPYYQEKDRKGEKLETGAEAASFLHLANDSLPVLLYGVLSSPYSGRKGKGGEKRGITGPFQLPFHSNFSAASGGEKEKGEKKRGAPGAIA